jgi:hypothetical protein
LRFLRASLTSTMFRSPSIYLSALKAAGRALPLNPLQGFCPRKRRGGPASCVAL